MPPPPAPPTPPTPPTLPPSGPPVGLADLVVDLSPATVTVSNVGDGPAGAFAVRVGRAAFSVGGLAPGASASFTWARSCSEGTVAAAADPGNAVPEANEGNNGATVSILC